MSTLGPNPPSSLQKRKRSRSSAESPNSPPHKLQAVTPPPAQVLGPTLPPQNPSQLPLDDDSSSDDGYGPSAPAKASSPLKKIVGPALPPILKNTDELDLEESEEEAEYGPSKPSNASAGKPSPPKKRVLGPAPPPAPLSEMPSHPPNTLDPSDSSADDDDYGPSLPPSSTSNSNSTFHPSYTPSSIPSAFDIPSSISPPKPQRESWMLIPPSALESQHRVDPTKLKNRKFASGKGASASSTTKGGGGISAIWTETPEEKRRRLEDEVLGRTEAATSSSAHTTASTHDREEVATERRIREYNAQNRSKSLLDEFSQGKEGERGREKEKEDDPSKRAFDREKDMALGGRLGHAQKREMLAKAREFGGRFERGKYL